MKTKFKSSLNLILNLSLLAAIIGVAYSWMITAPITGELVDYNRELLVTSSSVNVKIYAYTNGHYVEKTGTTLNLGLLAPGTVQKYRFDITNNLTGSASTKIVFSNIEGDIATIGDFLIFGSSSPSIFSYSLNSKVQLKASNNTYFLNFIDSITIPGNTTVSVYWYTKILTTATNDIAGKSISIDQISFIEP